MVVAGEVDEEMPQINEEHLSTPERKRISEFLGVGNESESMGEEGCDGGDDEDERIPLRQLKMRRVTEVGDGAVKDSDCGEPCEDENAEPMGTGAEVVGTLLPSFPSPGTGKQEEDIMFCSLCNFEVKLHSMHCRTCDRCVDGFDHHCRWLNNCIRRNNYTTFILLMVFILLMLAIEGGTAITVFPPKIKMLMIVRWFSRGVLPDHVRKEVIELGMPDDGYNYLLHLREIKNSGGGSTYYHNSKAKIDRMLLDVTGMGILVGKHSLYTDLEGLRPSAVTMS